MGIFASLYKRSRWWFFFAAYIFLEKTMKTTCVSRYRETSPELAPASSSPLCLRFGGRAGLLSKLAARETPGGKEFEKLALVRENTSA